MTDLELAQGILAECKNAIAQTDRAIAQTETAIALAREAMQECKNWQARALAAEATLKASGSDD